MKLLLDSHTLIWALDSPDNLGAQARELLKDKSNELFISSGTIWEIAIKVGLGKLTLSMPFKNWMRRGITGLEISVLPITIEHADMQAKLPEYHGDPFDRLLVGQSQVENIPILTKDSHLTKYGIDIFW
jgi:PIN domain nuclease of toxin-antitoxin system